MFCVKCGKQVEDEALFCPNCGTVVQSVKMEDSVSSNQKNNEMSHQNKKGMNKKRIAVIVGSILVVCLCIAIFSLIGGSKEPEIKEPSVVGQWKDLDEPSLLITLNEDETGAVESGGWAYNFTWDYNSSSHKLTLYVLGSSGILTYNPANDTIFGGDMTLVRVSK